MAWSSDHILAYLDGLHHHSALSPHRKRVLYGHVFGTDLPAFIIFHAMLGYVLLGIGLCALVLRLPVDTLRRKRWLHRQFGFLWIFGTIWMPVTAIWCVYEYTGWDVVAFFIYSMFAAIQIGWIFIQLYRKVKDKGENNPARSSKGVYKAYYILHALLMAYSFVMLLGAGISFPFRANSQFSREYQDYYANHH